MKNTNTINRIKSDSGLMGTSHALSSIALYLLLFSFYPTFFYTKVLQTNDIVVFIASIFVIGGAALLPDIDNTRSTVISTLGLLGIFLSTIMRGFSVLVYTASKTKYDSNDNPHRGFWHTIVGGAFLAFLVFLSVNIKTSIYVDYLKKDISIGLIFGVFWIFVCIKLAVAGLFSKFNKKLKKYDLGSKLIFSLFAIVLSLSVLTHIPDNVSYSWIAYSIFIGYILHIIGDMLTVSGVPILWPIEHKGKRWWHYRVAKFKAGGVVENMIIIPLSSFLIVATLIFYVAKLNNLIQ